jgi:hypothetical protein
MRTVEQRVFEAFLATLDEDQGVPQAVVTGIKDALETGSVDVSALADLISLHSGGAAA